MAEPLFMAVAGSSPEFLQTVRQAQESLAEFRTLLPSCTVDSHPCIKTCLVYGEEKAFIWLLVVRAEGTGFVGTLFEIPREFSTYQVGQEFNVPEEAVMDWMINDEGLLHGGFSLRYQRSLLPHDERESYDEYIGVTRYA